MKISEAPFLKANVLRRSVYALSLLLELALLTALILTTRCANFRDVFVEGKVYFVDADCYSRMTRARLVAEDPGLIVRHDDFENSPSGTIPHTTAPLDYLIVALGGMLSPLTAQPLDLAGAIVSPLLALCGGWFLWWWTRRLRFRYRWAALALYALSPILAHGTALGRPDHQALLIVLVLIALAAEWSLQLAPTRQWSVVSGLSWGMALWVSLYEPLLLLAALACRPGQLLARPRRMGWWLLGAMLLLAFLVERRWPQFPDSAARSFLLNWSGTIGELKPVSLTSILWWQWFGALVLIVPALLILARGRQLLPPAFLLLLGLTFLLTFCQARAGYFFALLLLLSLPPLLNLVRPVWLGGLLVAIALLPCLQFWNETLWPNEFILGRRKEARAEMVGWRAAASALPRGRSATFLAPWWLSPATAYWSRQPGVAGSSHESLAGIVDSARFFLAARPDEARAILRQHNVAWVLAYDSARVGENSAAILGTSIPPEALCFILDRSPSRAPPFLIRAGQNNACKLYRVQD